MKEREKKNPWQFAFAALAVYGAWELVWYLASWLIADVFGGISFPVTKAATIGIIGGADGPTSVFITSATGSVWELLWSIVCLFVGLYGYRYLKNGKRKA